MSTLPDTGAQVERWVSRDRAVLLYDHGAGALAMTLVTSVFLVLMVDGSFNRAGPLLWLAAVLAVLAVRAVDVVLLYPRRRTAIGDGRGQITRFGCGVLASASLWALFPILFFPELTDSGRAAASVILAAMASGSVAVLSPSLPLAATFCTALLVPPGVMLLLTPNRDSMLLGVLAVAAVPVMVMVVRAANRAVITAMRLGRMNEALVARAERLRLETEAANAQLAAAQVALNDINLSLERRIHERTADLAREMSERQRYAEALARLASTDPLTGLWNRTTFAERLACMLAKAAEGGTRLAVLFLDLDNFKQVNDVRGHPAGDQVLQTSSRLLSEAAGQAVQLARWGGDEFVMALPVEAGSGPVIRLAERLRDVLAKPLVAGLDSVRVDATIGIAMFPEDGQTQDELIRAADVAMYEAKKEGKGRIKLFDPALARNVALRHSLEQALRNAIGSSQFSLAFQPIISNRTGRCKAFEALLRWDHPALGPTDPSSFIPIAEQTGQIGALGRWVLLQACREAASWPSPAPAVTVNVSVAQVLSGTLLADVAEALAQTGLPPGRLELEITESMFVSDHRRIAPVFEGLRRQGHRILLDDFGTGFSSLAYLGKLPLDVIKIDQSFVHTAERDGFAIVQAILSIAGALSLEVTAEGVETEAQRDKLTSLGVDNLQGYLLGKPMERRSVADWLRSQAEPALAGAETGR